MTSSAGTGDFNPSVVSSAHLFEDLQDSAKSLLLDEAQRTAVPANVRLCSEGEIAGQLFLIQEGMISYGHLTQNGDQFTLFCLGPGESFGLGAILAKPHPYLGSATSLVASQVLSWDHAHIRRFALAHPQVSCNVVRVVLDYFALLAERHSDLVGNTARVRVAKALLQLGKCAGPAQTDGIDIPITNEQLASLADVSPFTVCRLLSQWGRSGTVEKGRKTLRILAPEELLPYSAM